MFISQFVEFNGLRILLIKEDAIAPQREITEADAVIRICRQKLPNVDRSPGIFVVKNL